MSKPKIIKDFSKLDKNLQNAIKLKYPDGYEEFLITFQNKEGQFISALPFETEEANYLVKMPVNVTSKVKDEDEEEDDFDGDGVGADEEPDFDDIDDEEANED